jgi:hypothetical protein
VIVSDDDITLGELSRQLADWRGMAQGNFAAIDTRLQGIAAQTVPGNVYQADRSMYDEKFLAAAKLSDERYQKLRDDISAIAKTQQEILHDAKERSKRIANNRTVIAMALFSGFLLPILILVLQKVVGL